ncbi:MAG: hypothetical protein EZS28_025176 [Streblomastix strix]|uniref:Uncharacterized protein n=1 Tax=Streblomastix strix TaxID=222440 RepID=A0A5J4V9R7_9EUKA|nr:MAG: hypothetical protein EZS28_025176 [Streblomastix strix]
MILLIKTPNAINSLSMLTSYKLNTHFNQKYDSQSQEIRNRSRECLKWIQYKGDAKVQSNLVNIGNGRVMSIVISTAGGIGEEQDKEILDVLMHIQWVFKALPKGSNDYPSFQPLPLLARRTEEQIEEEGANEELEAQMKKNKYGSYIMIWANKAKAAILNHFIHWSNIGPN